MLPTNHKILGFIPALVVEFLLNKIKSNQSRKLPEKQSFRSVVMFADISGFTNLTEKLSKRGSEGAELIAFALNRYMELLVNAIGDIFKFAGDAMIVLWPPPKDNSEEELITLCRQAIQSALDIQSRLHDTNILDDIKLSVKIGFGIGDVTILHVGGVFSRAEYLAVGEPLLQAFEAEHCAKGGGVIIISNEVWAKVFKYFDFEIVKDAPHSGNPFYFVTAVKKGLNVRMKADALLITSQMKPSDIESIKPLITSYIPAAIVPYIELSQEKWAGELRRLTVLFINLGIDLSDAKSDRGLERIQQVIETVQKVVYKFQGSLNKLLMDDKGSTLIVVFGLTPMSHQDDPIRGTLTALALIKSLKLIDCSCSVGVTTGVSFAGVVGTSGSRREYSILGDTVNLAARLMQAACKEKIKKIFVDDVTMKEAQCRMGFRFVRKDMVKGKEIEISFYEPIDPDDEDLATFPYNIRTHKNTPMKGETIQNEHLFMIGRSRENELKKILDLVDKFIKKNQHHMMILLVGRLGCGKSLFIRNLVQKILILKEKMTWKSGEFLNIFIRTSTPENKCQRLNGWIDIILQILKVFSMREKKTYEALMSQVFYDDHDIIENLEILEKILGISLKKKKNEKFSQSSLTQIEQSLTKSKIKEDKLVKRMVVKLLKKFGEEDNVSVNISPPPQIMRQISSDLIDSHGETEKKNKPIIATNYDTVPPLIIILDGMEDFDELSWRTTCKVMKNLQRVFLIGATRTDDLEIPIQFKKKDSEEERSVLEIIEEGIFDLEEKMENNYFQKIELADLTHEEILSLLRKMVNFNDIKFEKIQDNRPSSQSNNNFVQNNILFKKMPQTLLVDLLFSRTKGAPLQLQNYIENLIQQNYIYIDSNKDLIIRDYILKCIQINEFLTINVPLSILKINGPLMDKLKCADLLILKTAAVIGECFDFRTLSLINPLKKKYPSEKLFVLLDDLVTSGFIEILYEKDSNIRYRLTDPFMRETLYQRMTFSLRRQIHRAVANAIQDSQPIAGMNYDKVDFQRLIYHLSLHENTQGEKVWQVGIFSAKAKRSIVVKKISSILCQNQRDYNVTLLKGFLEKKSDRGLSWSPRFCLLNTKELKYYYSEDNFKASEDPLGSISLKHIYNIMPLDENQYKKANAFIIFTGSWFKKNKEMGIRNFYFSANDDELLEEWKTHIEFIRAKAIYDDFVKSFGKISFPLIKSGEDDDLDIRRNQEKESPLKSNLSTTNSKSSKSIFLSRKTRKTLDKKNSQLSEFNLNYQSQMIDNTNQLKENLMTFFNHAFLTFYSHLIDVSDSVNIIDRDETALEFGRENEFIKKNTHIFANIPEKQIIKENELNINSPSFQKRKQKKFFTTLIPQNIEKNSILIKHKSGSMVSVLDFSEEIQENEEKLKSPVQSLIKTTQKNIEADEYEINLKNLCEEKVDQTKKSNKIGEEIMNQKLTVNNSDTIEELNFNFPLKNLINISINFNDKNIKKNNNLHISNYFGIKKEEKNLNYGSIHQGIPDNSKIKLNSIVSKTFTNKDIEVKEIPNFVGFALKDIYIQNQAIRKGESILVRSFNVSNNTIVIEKNNLVGEFDVKDFYIISNANNQF